MQHVCETLSMLVCFSSHFPAGVGLKQVGEELQLLLYVSGYEGWFNVLLVVGLHVLYEVVLFLEPKESTNSRFMSIIQVEMSLRKVIRCS